ncbi:MAG TPA: 4-alpha-glucanotransferase [Chloroflexota bacterium]
MVRAAGVLLHPTSLPGPYGVGDLGPSAQAFLQFLTGAKQRYWQLLPLGPAAWGESPYQAYSAFAGNPLLLSPDLLVADGLLSDDLAQRRPAFSADQVEFARVRAFKQELLEEAFQTFQRAATAAQQQEVAQFAQEQAFWLDDYALFAALSEVHNGAAWPDWEPGIAAREPEALALWRERLATPLRYQVFVQYLFFRQWAALKRQAAAYGIRLLGDMPIYISHNSADCWAHRELFTLDARGEPTHVAGVPPDYFSETGQRWGNPLYRWDVLAATGYAWWVERLRSDLSLVDVLRLDHFRGFAAYWAIPAHLPTAVGGRWRRGPGAALFKALEQALGPLPLIAEDLGKMSNNVQALRDRFRFPGMKVLQFAFGGDAANPFLPHNYTRNFVVYTGTHDNDTTAGWLATAATHERRYAERYAAAEDQELVWAMIRLAYQSVAELCIIPMQDLLGLGSEARMNFPGTVEGNWGWRYAGELPDVALAARLADLTACYGRT